MSAEHAALRSFGLTEYEARTYAALVAMEPGGHAPDVADAAAVPRTKVYTVLRSLVAKGWADVERGRPSRYRAQPPSACFQRERGRLDALAQSALAILEAQYHDRSRRFAGSLWVLQGEALVRERTLEMIRSAREEITFIASFPIDGDERVVPKAIGEAVARGVAVRVAGPKPDGVFLRTLARAGAEVRGLAIPPRVLAVDGRQALLAFRHGGPDGPSEVRGIWNPSVELMQVLGGVIQFVWSDSAQVRATPVRAEPARPAPRPPSAKADPRASWKRAAPSSPPRNP
ncbi:MAG: TrmB family transcriptional regulator [Thermoplasmatota archaeon]